MDKYAVTRTILSINCDTSFPCNNDRCLCHCCSKWNCMKRQRQLTSPSRVPKNGYTNKYKNQCSMTTGTITKIFLLVLTNHLLPWNFHAVSSFPILVQHSRVTVRMTISKRLSFPFINRLSEHSNHYTSKQGIPDDTMITSLSSTKRTTDSIQIVPTNKPEFWIPKFLQLFQGDFDNYHQVVQDRSNNLYPREGGGHEHIHCTLVPMDTTPMCLDNGLVGTRLAAFYFDGTPQRIFRFRYYELLEQHDIQSCDDNNIKKDKGSTKAIQMRLYTLHPTIEQALRARSEYPEEWPSLFHSVAVSADDTNTEIESSNTTNKNYENNNNNNNKVNYLPNCDVVWSLYSDPIEHSYLEEFGHNTSSSTTSTSLDDDIGIHAVMDQGEAIVDSTMIPGQSILIHDQLSMYSNVFYINDRGFDPETRAYIYGNQRGIPYRLDRVTNFDTTATMSSSFSSTSSTTPRMKLQRNVLGGDDDDDDDGKSLKWTLGPQWRNESIYETKMKAIDGPSVQFNRVIRADQGKN